MKKKILYCGYGWANNIGNSFIDFGIEYQLKKSINDDYELITASTTTSFHKTKFSRDLPYRLFHQKKNEVIDYRTLFDADFVVFGGSLLDPFWMKMNQSYINYLIKNKIKIIIIGGSGGNAYNNDNYKFITDILKRMNLVAFISRDIPTFENYNKYSLVSYNGIDNALFLNDVYKPSKININNIGLIVFDFIKEPKIDLKRGIKYFKLHNSLTDMVGYEGIIKNPFKQLRYVNESIVNSDYPQDYLNFFGNSKCTYSDRVHACVATLIYGGEAQYFDKSSRSHLFERIGVSEIKNKLVKLDLNFIEIEKKKQIEFLKNVFDEY